MLTHCVLITYKFIKNLMNKKLFAYAHQTVSNYSPKLIKPSQIRD